MSTTKTAKGSQGDTSAKKITPAITDATQVDKKQETGKKNTVAKEQAKDSKQESTIYHIDGWDKMTKKEKQAHRRKLRSERDKLIRQYNKAEKPENKKPA